MIIHATNELYLHTEHKLGFIFHDKIEARIITPFRIHSGTQFYEVKHNNNIKHLQLHAKIK